MLVCKRLTPSVTTAQAGEFTHNERIAFGQRVEDVGDLPRAPGRFPRRFLLDETDLPQRVLVGKHKDICLIFGGVLVTGRDAEVTDCVRALTWHTKAGVRAKCLDKNIYICYDINL